MANTEITNVSDTALWVAVYRARESQRQDALFKDPYAEILSGERGKKIADSTTSSRYTSWSVVIRTYVIDNYIRELIAGGVDTIMNLGAGLDTRPYRMNLPSSLRWIEVDFSHMINLKNEKLKNEKPVCNLERIAVDLSDAVARKKLFADIGSKSKKVLVLTEGVIPYLTTDQVADLAGDLKSQPSFHYWIVDYFAPQIVKYFRTRKMRQQMRNAPFQFFPEDPFEFFLNHGWKKKELHFLAEESLKLGRPIPMPWWARILLLFTSEKRKLENMRFSGYMLLEPG